MISSNEITNTNTVDAQKSREKAFRGIQGGLEVASGFNDIFALSRQSEWNRLSVINASSLSLDEVQNLASRNEQLNNARAIQSGLNPYTGTTSILNQQIEQRKAESEQRIIDQRNRKLDQLSDAETTSFISKEISIGASIFAFLGLFL